MNKYIVVDIPDGAPDSTLTRLEHLRQSSEIVPPLDADDEAILDEITGGDYGYFS